MPSRPLAALLTLGGLLATLDPGLALADEPRPAAEILKDFDAVTTPTITNEQAKDKAALKSYREAYTQANRRKGNLALELLQADPDNPRLMEALQNRWTERMMDPGTAAETVAEIDRALPHLKIPAQAREARFFQVIASIRKDRAHPESAMPLVDAFIHDDPKDERGAVLLNGLSSEVSDPTLKTSLLKRLVAEYPESRAARSATRALELAEKVGKPLDLEFTDAIKGSTISIKGLKGKVVVLDFWATWCGPCVAEMPKMKELYARFHDQGVEFLGISLDAPKEEGGLDKLKDFVAKNDIPWPQFYQGNGWESDFSAEMGIDSIPRLFVVDAEGKIASVDARGKLEELIPDLLAKAKTKADAR